MRTIKNLTAMIGSLILIVMASGCSTDSNLTGPEETEKPDTKYYDVTFTIHRFHVSGDCDGGLNGKGELSYGIEVKRETFPGSGIYKHVKYVDSKDYPKSSGTKHKKANGDDINIKQEVFVGRLEEGCDYRLIASAIEWDGVLGNQKDERMSGSPKTETNTAGGKDHYEHKMTLGSSGSCKLYLYFDADEKLVK
jgi:hypothetical protein